MRYAETGSNLQRKCRRGRLVVAAILMTGVVLPLPGSVGAQPAGAPYKDPRLPVETRVRDLLSRMTLEEKFRQLFMVSGDLSEGREKYRDGIFGLQMATTSAGGDVSGQILRYGRSGTARSSAETINATQRFFVEETRLGIPIIPFDEALHGLVRDGATAFPQAIALAASWNPALVSRVAHAIAKEVRARGIRQILSPVVNVATDVRWGRVEETYGEDPYLSSMMGAAFVREFERLGVITTPKHFVANHGDGGRDSYPVHWNERLLEEVYFPPFVACFREGGARSVMPAYNSLDGTACNGNPWLLNQKLRREWGFRGFVISDAGAVGGMNDLHRTSRHYAESARLAIEAGLDVLLQTSVDHFPLFFRDSLENRRYDLRVVDEAAARVLRAKFELGLFEDPYSDVEEAARWNGHKDHRELARQSAREGMVLLKNQGSVLPLSKGIRSIAVIGPDAAELRLGGYSGPGIRKVSILEGIRANLQKQSSLHYAEGCRRESPGTAVVPAGFLRPSAGSGTGLRGSYWASPEFSGEPTLQRTDSEIQFSWNIFSPHPSISVDRFSARWEGDLMSPADGPVRIGLEGNDGFRLYLNDSLLIDHWEKVSYRTALRRVEMVKGRAYRIKIEYRETTGNGRLRLVWDHGTEAHWQQNVDEAVQAAKMSDASVIVAGLLEGESFDRASLALPGHQRELIAAVAAVGKPVIVIIIGGSAVTMDPWIEDVDAVLLAWYPGEDGGNAVAEILFGDYSPAGRLPITFPLAVAQVPLVYNHKPTGRLDYYRDLPGEPLFPFGHGLSYTTFEYSDLGIDNTIISGGDSARVRFLLRNTGPRAGDEVVQLYLTDVLGSVARPVMELKGFQRITLRPGESREVEFIVTPAMLTMLNAEMQQVIEPGDFRIMIGGSSKDIRLRGILTVR